MTKVDFDYEDVDKKGIWEKVSDVIWGILLASIALIPVFTIVVSIVRELF